MNSSLALVGPTCRACLQSSNSSVPIFSKIENSNLTLAEMLKYCSLEVKQNGNLPDTMCMNCGDSIQQFYNFVKVFRNSESFFEQHLSEIVENKAHLTNISQIARILEDDDETQTIIIPAELTEHDYNIVVIEEEPRVKRTRRCNGDVSYECPNCDATFKKFAEFNHHMREYLGEIQCKLCPQMVDSFNFAAHFKADHRFKCKGCDDRFGSHKIMKEHSNIHTESDGKTLEMKGRLLRGPQRNCECPVCDLKLSKISNLYSHIESFHKDLSDCKLCENTKIDVPFLDHFKEHHVAKCKWCPRLFYGDSKDTIEEHHKRHRKPEDMFELNQTVLGDGEPSFIHTCPVCEDVGFTSVESLADHLEQEHNSDPITCLLCKRLFETPYEFTTHYQNLHTLKDKETEGGYKDHYCPVCNKCFGDFNKFSIHMNNKHNKIGDASISCHLCPEVFEADVYLQHYTKMHRYQCQLCMKTLSQRYPYDRHIDTHLNKYFVCQIEGCEKAFGAKNSLRQHVLNMHNEEKNFLCNQCGMAFKSTDGLRYHMKKHQGRRFLCTYCGKRFIQSAHLNHHLWRHTGRKPYNCKECGKSCVSKKLLIRHMEKGFCNKTAASEEIYIRGDRKDLKDEDGDDTVFYSWEEEKNADSEAD